MKTAEWKRQMRTVATEFATREDSDNLIIEGYFAVFNSNYEIGPGRSESIAPGAFSRSMSNDVRALVNHDSTLVLGRTKAGTLEIKQTERGLWGRIIVNPNDRDAVNAYERVKRRDVDQFSFGFDIVAEDAEYRDDGSVHWTITDIELYEVSVCTFPAYEETEIMARSAEVETHKQRELEAWRIAQKERLNNA